MPSYHGIAGWLLKLGLLRVAVTQLVDISEISERSQRQGSNAHSGKRCAVFTHMNKSAGSTVKFMLRAYSKAEDLRLGLFGNNQYVRGAEATTAFVHEEYDVIVGGYTEGLRSIPSQHPEWTAESCEWFTMFRQ